VRISQGDSKGVKNRNKNNSIPDEVIGNVIDLILPAALWP
jgi:hypothetical protein